MTVDDFIVTQVTLTHCMFGNFLCFLSSADIFLLKKFFQEYHQNVKQFGP